MRPRNSTVELSPISVRYWLCSPALLCVQPGKGARAHNLSAKKKRQGAAWSSPANQPNLIIEPQVPVRDSVSEDKVDRPLGTNTRKFTSGPHRREHVHIHTQTHHIQTHLHEHTHTNKMRRFILRKGGEKSQKTFLGTKILFLDLT